MTNFLDSVKLFYNENKKKVFRTVVVLGVFFLMLFSDFGYITTIQLLVKNNELRSKIDLFNIKNDSLIKRIQILKTDSTEIERMAREHFGLIRTDEEVFIAD